MATVSLQHVYKDYPPEHGKVVTAVSDFCLDVRDREFVVLVGPSGCGKSTTLRMIAGLEEISRGDIFIGDRRVNDVAPKDRDIAMVFQNYALYPHMTVFDNMAFGLKLRKVPKQEIKKRVTDAAGILGIEALLERRPKALSGGQRQRVAVGRAMVRQPKVFLFDEPLSNLDASMRVQMRTEITKLHQRLQATMIYVTHDQVEAMTMGTRIVIMKDGVIQQTDAPLAIYNHPRNQFVAGFLGSPQMNQVPGQLHKSVGGVAFKESDGGSLTVNLGASEALLSHVGQDIILGIRPEDLEGIATEATPGAGTFFQAIVEIVEPVGAETFVHVSTGRRTLISRSRAAMDQSECGRRMKFSISPSKIHWFDPGSGARISIG